jgi:hypothetical protein
MSDDSEQSRRDAILSQAWSLQAHRGGRTHRGQFVS